jgi:hypothetical protein
MKQREQDSIKKELKEVKEHRNRFIAEKVVLTNELECVRVTFK